jgi:uncharacterized membrane protein
MRQTLGIWKTTVLGGIFFLLPFAVVVFLIGELAAIVVPVAKQLQPYLPESNLFGYVSLATLLAIALLIALCFLAGVIARRSFASRFSSQIEKYLLMLFPRYAIIKDQMASNIGGAASRPQLAPVLVRFDDAARMGFEVERTDGSLVTVYLPGSPDPWQGQVVHVQRDRVTPLGADFGQAIAMCETLGRGGTRMVGDAAQSASQPSGLVPSAGRVGEGG